jgi:hypothetical protein
MTSQFINTIYHIVLSGVSNEIGIFISQLMYWDDATSIGLPFEHQKSVTQDCYAVKNAL